MTDPRESEPPSAAGPQAGRRAAQVVRSVEGAVESAVLAAEGRVEGAVEAAEQSLARRLGAGGLRACIWGLRGIGWLALVFYFIFCASLISLRVWWMPHIDRWRGDIEAAASAMVKQQVTIGRIESSWQGINPRIQLTDVQLHDAQGAVALTLPQIEAVMSWTSVPLMQARVKSLVVLAPEVEVRRISESQLRVAGMLIDLQAPSSDTSALSWALEQRHVAISHATVHYYDEQQAGAAAAGAVAINLSDVNLVLSHHLGTHYFALRARPPSDVADLIDVRGWFDRPWSMPVADPRGWSGRLFAQLNFVDLARLESIARVSSQSVRLQRGNGALRAWIDFNALHVRRARVDVGFSDVELRLSPDLQALRLDSLQGRITQQAWRTSSAQGQDIALQHVALQGPGGLHLPATDLTIRLSRPVAGADAPPHTEVGISALALEDLAALASRVPLPAQARELVARYEMRGTVSDLHAAWDGNPEHVSHIALRTRFDRLALEAQPAVPAFDETGRPRTGQPGFRNLSGSIDVSQAGGSLTVAGTDAHLLFPGLLAEPDIAADRLEARVRWKTGSNPEVDVDALSFSNDDLEFSASGAYRPAEHGPGWADLNGELTRARAASVYRYVPAAAGDGTRQWLRYALRDGRISEGTLRLHGDLGDFPRLGRDGQFKVSMHIAGAALDYAPSTPTRPRPHPWPMMTGVETDLEFNGDQVDIVGGQASVYGVRLAKVNGRIVQFSGRDPHLAISGQGAGELSELLGYVNASPVSDMIGGFLQTAKASGPGRLQIKLDIPLNHSVDTAVDGSVLFQGNDLLLRADLSPFNAMSGHLDFNQHGVRVPGISAAFVGGQTRIEADTIGGAVTVRASGTATPAGLRRQFDAGPVRHLLESTHGITRYAVSLTLRGKSVEVHATSDLTGVAIDLPEPLAKAAGDALPLRFDLIPGAAGDPARDSLRVTAGSLIDIDLERVAGAAEEPMHLERGVIGIGAPGVLPDSGLLVNLALPRLDTDRWSSLLEAAPEEGGAGAAGGMVPDLVAARLDELTISGKVLHNVVLGATRGSDGSWDANVVADQTSGSLHWMAGTRSAPGKLTARLAHLQIPESARGPVTEALDAPARELPELDVVADDFVLGSNSLGRLELDAQNVRVGRSTAWQLKLVRIDSPDAGSISGTGQWQREPGSQRRRMSLTLTVDVLNAGKLLGRFGMRDAIKNGAGKLTGHLSWLGSPFSIDYPTLSGDLRLDASKGQFLKAEPGAGRLLGLMSLQSLPRRVSLDFRDVFSKGFAFDTIHATAQVNNGVLSTRDFNMAGPGASVLIEGETDLQAESQNLHVVVLPEIDASSASVLYAFLVNPAVGVGAFLAQWLLRHPLSKIFSYEYDVTGSWGEPQVKRHERAKPETPEEKTG